MNYIDGIGPQHSITIIVSQLLVPIYYMPNVWLQKVSYMPWGLYIIISTYRVLNKLHLISTGICPTKSRYNFTFVLRARFVLVN